MRTYVPGAGDTIQHTAARMAYEANEYNREVTAKFNDMDLFAKPGDNPKEIVRKYEEECQEAARKFRESPAGKEAQRQQDEHDKEAAKAEAEGILSYSRKDGMATEYQEYVAKNTDGYGACTVRYGARWANLMETLMNAGATLADIAKKAGHEANREGITGFMYGCAVQELSRFWIHGEELRRWHNLDTQVRGEGVKANESGAVLNPALMTFETKEK